MIVKAPCLVGKTEAVTLVTLIFPFEIVSPLATLKIRQADRE